MQIKYYGNLVRRTNCKEEELNASDVKELLNAVKERHGDEVFKIAKVSHILVNDTNARSINGFKTKLEKDDIVKFLPVCGGG